MDCLCQMPLPGVLARDAASGCRARVPLALLARLASDLLCVSIISAGSEQCRRSLVPRLLLTESTEVTLRLRELLDPRQEAALSSCRGAASWWPPPNSVTLEAADIRSPEDGACMVLGGSDGHSRAWWLACTACLHVCSMQQGVRTALE